MRPTVIPGFTPAAREPHSERTRVVVPADELRVVPPFVHRGAAELAAPHDERVIEHPALLQILHQRGRRAIGLLAQRRERGGDVVDARRPVVIPAPVVELDETDAALDEAAREQAVVRKRRRSGLGTVELVDPKPARPRYP